MLAAALAPTDAGLGAATVLNPVVPVRVRRVLNVESGLNDGLTTPIVLFALAAARTEGGHEPGSALRELAVGVVIGVVGGVLAGRLLERADAHGLVSRGLVPIGTVAVPLLCYFGASACTATVSSPRSCPVRRSPPVQEPRTWTVRHGARSSLRPTGRPCSATWSGACSA